MIQDKIFFDEKDPTGLSYNTPFTYYGSYQGRLWSKSPTGSIKYYTQNSDLSVYATTGSNQFSGSQTITGSLTVTGTITGTVAGTTATASYVEYTNVANKPALVSGSSQVTYSGLTGIPSGIVSGSAQVTYSGLTGVPSGIVSGSAQISDFGIFATTGSNGFNGSQSITGSLTVTGQVIAQTLNVQQVTSSIVYSSGSNIFGNTLGNTQQFTGSVSVTGSLAVAGAGTFSNNITATGNLNLQGAVTRNINFYDSSNTNINAQIQYDQISSTSGQLFFGTNNAGTFATRLTISNTGAATFSSTIAASGRISTSHSTSGDYAAVFYNTSATGEGVTIRGGSTSSHNALIVQPYNGATTLFSILATGAATFTESLAITKATSIFQLGNSTNNSYGAVQFLGNATGNGNTLGELDFYNKVTGVNTVSAQIEIIHEGSSADNKSAMYFKTHNGTSLITPLTIASTGAATFSSSVTAATTLTGRTGFTTGGSGGAPFYDEAIIIGQPVNPCKIQFGNSFNDDNGSWLRFVVNGIAATNTPITAMTIAPTGNVGIGTASPAKRLNVEASVAGEVAQINNTRNSASGDYALVTLLGTNCNNTNNYHYIAATGGTDRMYIYGNGNIVNTNGSYGTLSDISLKENIVDATPKLADLLQLKVRNFNLIDSEEKQIGFVAQEFEEIFPKMVDIDGKNGMKTIKTSVLVPMLVKAIQELKSELDTAKAEIQLLKQQ